MAKTGRPSAYKDEYLNQARKLCALGATDENLADFFGVSIATIYNWKNEFPQFLEALKEAKEERDARVEKSLLERASGYTHKEEKIFCVDGEILRAETEKHYPPDPTSMIFWLKNRQPQKWRDRQELTGADGAPLQVTVQILPKEGIK